MIESDQINATYERIALHALEIAGEGLRIAVVALGAGASRRSARTEKDRDDLADIAADVIAAQTYAASAVAHITAAAPPGWAPPFEAKGPRGVEVPQPAPPRGGDSEA